METATGSGISLEELQMAARNHGMPLEALRWDITPIGLHYLLIHYDIPEVDPESYRLESEEEQLYARSLPLDELVSTEAILAYEINGVPLPPQHGFPLRLVVPGWYGMTSVKWLASVEVIDEPFAGYQQAVGYRMRADEDDPGTPVTRIMPRSL